jgi:hypothetical protein
MGNINNVINVAIALNDRFTSIPSLDVEAHIVDSDLIPIDQRVRVIGVNDDLATLLGDDEAVYNFAVTYFSQTALSFSFGRPRRRRRRDSFLPMRP